MSGSQLDIEMMKQIFADKRTHVALAKIKQLAVAPDRSYLKCLVAILPEQREVIARMAWPSTGPESGIFDFPEKDDLVLVELADGNDDYAFVTSRLTSQVDKIPLKAIDGHMVVRSKAGKQVWITSNSKIYLSKGDGTPAENLVLGQKLKTLLADLLTKVAELSEKVSLHTHAGNLGYPTSPPNEAADFVSLQADFDELKESPVQDEQILSNISFTEKG